MSNPFKIKVVDIEENFILLAIMPPFPGLSKDDVNLTYNGNKISNFTLEESSIDGSMYKIIPYTPFTCYDYITFQIIKTGYLSDEIKIYFAKCFYNGTAGIEFKFPDETSGEYKIRLMTLNGSEFNMASEIITVSLTLKIEDCTAVLNGSGTYNIDEEVFVNVELYGTDGNRVPNGIYQVELLAEPI